MREEVSKKFGEDFLLQHEVNQLESSIMELIKSKIRFRKKFLIINNLTFKIKKKKKLKQSHHSYPKIRHQLEHGL